MARTGMADAIKNLRLITETADGDYTVNGVTYWTDDQLQAALDRRREDVFSESLESVSTVSAGTTYWYDYYFTPAQYEQGTAQFRVTNSLGQAITYDAINYDAGHLSFGTVNQGGTSYYITARRYDLNAAAADIWRQKAAHVAAAYDFSADGQSMSRSQMKTHYMEMAKLYDSQSQPITATMTRRDLN